MKKLLTILFTIASFAGFADGDSGEIGGPRIVRSHTLQRNELNVHPNRSEYAVLLWNLERLSGGNLQEPTSISTERLLRRNLGRSMYIGNPYDSSEYVQDGDEFLIIKKNVKAEDFGRIELKSVTRFYLAGGRVLDRDSVVSYSLRVDERGPHVMAQLLELRTRNGTKVYVDQITKVKVEFRK